MAAPGGFGKTMYFRKKKKTDVEFTYGGLSSGNTALFKFQKNISFLGFVLDVVSRKKPKDDQHLKGLQVSEIWSLYA